MSSALCPIAKTRQDRLVLGSSAQRGWHQTMFCTRVKTPGHRVKGCSAATCVSNTTPCSALLTAKEDSLEAVWLDPIIERDWIRWATASAVRRASASIAHHDRASRMQAWALDCVPTFVHTREQRQTLRRRLQRTLQHLPCSSAHPPRRTASRRGGVCCWQ